MLKKIISWLKEISQPPIIQMSVWEKSIREEPEEWAHDKKGYILVHSSGASLWIANGKGYLEPYPCSEYADHFTRVDKERIWQAYQWWVANTPLEQQAR